MEMDALSNEIFNRFRLNREKRKKKVETILAQNLSKVRTKLGEVKTTLTYAIGAAEGVGKYSVKEIMYVYGVNRSTAYRWKKFDCHPWEKPKLDSNSKIRWADLPKKPSAASSNRHRPFNFKRDAICQARSSVRCALKKLKAMMEDPRYDRFPLDADCEQAAKELLEAAQELENKVYFERHPDALA